MRPLKWLGSALVCTLFTSCDYFPQMSSALDSGPLKVEGSRITYVGEVNQKFYQELRKVVNENTTDLYIASPGGYTDPTYRVAHLIRQYKLNITVTGPCISACSILLPAGAKKRVLPGAYLGYHWNGQSNTVQRTKLINQGGSNDFIETLARDVEDTFNTEVGIQQALYDDAWLLTNVRLKEKFGFLPRTWQERLQFVPIWLPTPAELACYGLKTDEFWYPTNGNLAEIPWNYRLGPQLFTTRMLDKLPAGLSKCVGVHSPTASTAPESPGQ